MKDTHLTLRLPRELARALARWARARGVPRSQVVREAVSRYLGTGMAAAAPEPPPSPTPAGLTARGLAERWAALPRLTPDEAESLERDITSSRAAQPPLRTAWE